MADVEGLREDLDREEPVYITDEGEIIEASETENRGDQQINRDTRRPVTKLKPTRWYLAWYDANRERLVRENQAMQQRFPQFELKRVSKGLAWHGSLRTNNGNKYKVAVVYPSDFPYSSPTVYPIRPKISSGKHQYGDDSLCLFYPSDRTWQSNTTAATVVAWAATWLFCYESYKETGHWPGQAAPHW